MAYPIMPGYGGNNGNNQQIQWDNGYNTSSAWGQHGGAALGTPEFNPNAPMGNGFPTPNQNYQTQQYWMGKMPEFYGQINGLTPSPQPYWQNTMGYAKDATNQAAQQYGDMAQKFGSQMFNTVGNQWNQQLAGNPAYAQWQNLLNQQGNEATGAAPQYLQDLWARSANSRLNTNMGAFGAPNSQFAANEFGRLNAADAQQYHQQAMQNLGGTINQGNNYMNPYMSSVVGTMGNIYASGVGNAANQGYNFGNQAYANAVAPWQNTQNALIKRFIA